MGGGSRGEECVACPRLPRAAFRSTVSALVLPRTQTNLRLRARLVQGLLVDNLAREVSVLLAVVELEAARKTALRRRGGGQGRRGVGDVWEGVGGGCGGAGVRAWARRGRRGRSDRWSRAYLRRAPKRLRRLLRDARNGAPNAPCLKDARARSAARPCCQQRPRGGPPQCPARPPRDRRERRQRQQLQRATVRRARRGGRQTPSRAAHTRREMESGGGGASRDVFERFEGESQTAKRFFFFLAVPWPLPVELLSLPGASPWLSLDLP